LQRCVPCYEKLKETETKRPKRERNYKSEAFKNKYVVWNHYVKGAKKRNIDFILPKTKFYELIVEKCYYCDYKVDNEINGIDRIDNNKGYMEENVVTCCQFCNVAKSSQHPQEFIDKMRAIHQFITNGIKIEQSVIDKWKTTYLSKKPTVYIIYKKSANTRKYDFTITEEEFNAIISKPCYLCGTNDKNGIDRFKNNIGYVLENCRPCCGHCNLLKKDLNYEHIVQMAQGIDRNYDKLTQFFSTIEVNVRRSKIEPRIKVENPIVAESENREYKPLEIIEIKEFPEMKFIKPEKKIKQWKVAQIQKAFLENKENKYKEFCEQNTIPDWDIKWATFVLSVKSTKESEKIIRDFIEDLRRIRHNELCYNKNAKIVDREDREQWPSNTVLRAYEDGKINQFKEFQEKYTGDKPEDVFWKNKWAKFIEDLKGDNKIDIIKKFMTAQRTRVYRAKKRAS